MHLLPESINCLFSQVLELVADMPDPTQLVKSTVEDQDTRAFPDCNTLEEDLSALRVNTSENELLSDIFGLDLRREGGQYKLTPHDPKASLTELLTSPIPAPGASTATFAGLQNKNQVSWILIFFELPSDHQKQDQFTVLMVQLLV